MQEEGDDVEPEEVVDRAEEDANRLREREKS